MLALLAALAAGAPARAAEAPLLSRPLENGAARPELRRYSARAAERTTRSGLSVATGGPSGGAASASGCLDEEATR